MSFAQTLMERVDAMMEARRKAQEVRCPSCGYTFNAEDKEGLVTYWGEVGPQDEECPACEQALRVTEHVERTYDVEVVTPAEPEGES